MKGRVALAVKTVANRYAAAPCRACALNYQSSRQCCCRLKIINNVSTLNKEETGRKLVERYSVILRKYVYTYQNMSLISY